MPSSTRLSPADVSFGLFAAGTARLSPDPSWRNVAEPSADSVPARKFIVGLPMNPATNLFPG